MEQNIMTIVKNKCFDNYRNVESMLFGKYVEHMYFVNVFTFTRGKTFPLVLFCYF